MFIIDWGPSVATGWIQSGIMPARKDLQHQDFKIAFGLCGQLVCFYFNLNFFVVGLWSRLRQVCDTFSSFGENLTKLNYIIC